jgi:NAD(P)-dependent dehydrogenase (short-subunit alcohol dehydrogenase family)
MKRKLTDVFDLTGKVAIITGGAGLLGVKHAEALVEAGASCILADINGKHTSSVAERIARENDANVIGIETDITQTKSIQALLEETLQQYGRIDILINNAANNPQYEKLSADKSNANRFESFPLSVWNDDVAVGLTGSFLCSQIIGSYLANQGQGVILNIASDLALIGPDQRIYKQDGMSPEQQPTKPVTYSVVKAGIIGLTRYLATYWADRGVRANALVPGGVYTNQAPEFVMKLTNLIPLGRMANADEYKAAVVFLCSQASAYMTGAMLIIDGGRTCW